jgi:hypothetical protein
MSNVDNAGTSERQPQTQADPAEVPENPNDISFEQAISDQEIGDFD